MSAYLVRLGPPAHGDVIHTSTCRHATAMNALRWVWADQTVFSAIDWDALRRHGIRPCRRCHPELLRQEPER